MEVMNFPNFVNFAPGIQVMKIAIRQRIVYIIITAESKDKIVRNISSLPDYSSHTSFTKLICLSFSIVSLSELI